MKALRSKELKIEMYPDFNLGSLVIQLEMKKIFPQKSLFGFSILGSWHSSFAAYGMLLSLFILLPLFGNKPHELRAGYLFLLLLNLSTLILTFNSIQQKNKKPLLLWIVLNLPLWLLIPMEIRIVFHSINQLKG